MQTPAHDGKAVNRGGKKNSLNFLSWMSNLQNHLRQPRMPLCLALSSQVTLQTAVVNVFRCAPRVLSFTRVKKKPPITLTVVTDIQGKGKKKKQFCHSRVVLWIGTLRALPCPYPLVPRPAPSFPSFLPPYSPQVADGEPNGAWKD